MKVCEQERASPLPPLSSVVVQLIILISCSPSQASVVPPPSTALEGGMQPTALRVFVWRVTHPSAVDLATACCPSSKPKEWYPDLSLGATSGRGQDR